MAADFGFKPDGKDYFFISYNSEDSGRVAPIALKLHKMGIPLWYDYGLEYGDEWERQIAEHIQGCKGVIMFITKGIFAKEHSYVRTEYKIAGYYNKKIYPAILDNIKNSDVPPRFVGWWADLEDLHGILQPTAKKIAEAIGFKSTGQSAAIDSTLSAVELDDKGEDYYYGRNGVKQDYSEAVRYFRLAAEQGNETAKNNLKLLGEL